MKKLIHILCVYLAAALLLAACGGNGSTTTDSSETSAPTNGGHAHTLTQAEYDAQEHWGTCECGEAVREPHTFGETGRCDVCGIAVVTYSDSFSYLITYDELDSMKTVTEYDPEGNIFSEILYEREYYDDGNLKTVLEYHSGVLGIVSHYLPCENPENGEVYMSERIATDDHYKEVEQYNEEGHRLSYISYDSEGNIISEETAAEDGTVLSRIDRVYDDEGNLFYEEAFEYEQDEDGNLIKVISSRTDDYQYIDKLDPEGHYLYSASYDGDGNITGETTYEYERDVNGSILRGTSRYYEDGILYETTELFPGPAGDLHKSSQTYYDNGKPRITYTFEYEFADTGDVIYQCRFHGDSKDTEYFYEYDTYADRYYLAREICDMGSYIKEAYYTSDGQCIKEVFYDYEGNVIEDF